jgi:hypothetical protein
MADETHETHEEEITPNGQWASHVTSTEGRSLVVAMSRVSSGLLDLSQSLGKLAGEVAVIGKDVRELKADVSALKKSDETQQQKLASVPDLDAIEGIAEKTGRHILKSEAERIVTNDKLRILEDRQRKLTNLIWTVAKVAGGAGAGFVFKHLLTLWGH